MSVRPGILIAVALIASITLALFDRSKLDYETDVGLMEFSLVAARSTLAFDAYFGSGHEVSLTLFCTSQRIFPLFFFLFISSVDFRFLYEIWNAAFFIFWFAFYILSQNAEMLMKFLILFFCFLTGPVESIGV